MAREIKFRVWDARGTFNKGIPCMHNDVLGLTIFEAVWFGDDFPKMQFTGFYDRNNVPIYEGDILHVVVILTETISPYNAVVEWDKYRFCISAIGKIDFQVGPFPLNNLDPIGLDLEVIGNKFEHPHLLES